MLDTQYLRMDAIIAILFLIGLFVLVLPIIAIIVASKASGDSNKTQREIKELKQLVADLQRQLTGQSQKPTQLPEKRAATTEAQSAPVPKPQEASKVVPKPQPPPPVPATAKTPEPPKAAVPVAEEALPKPSVVATQPAPTPSAKPAFSLEQFMGVKLFAWLGGIAMFFGVIFFVKYAFENNLISPAMRVTLGFITGLALLVGGLWIHRRKPYKVLAQSLTATGILVLYGVSFAAHAIYQFPAFNVAVTFTLMSLVTVTAFLISVRLNAQVVAVLGILGGFISPLLLPAVQDNPFGLFGYIALLDAGILATTRYKPWRYLPICAVFGTLVILTQWHASFFTDANYDEGAKTLIPMGLLVFFTALFGVAAWDKKRSEPSAILPPIAALLMNSAAMIFAFGYLAFTDISTRPFVLYGFIFTLNLIPLGISQLEPRLNASRIVTGLATFLHLAIWTGLYLKTENLNSALTLYLIFGALHAGYPIILQRILQQPLHQAKAAYSSWFLPISLILVSIAVGIQKDASLGVWVVVLIADLIVIFIAALSGAILVVLGSLFLTLFIAALWLLSAPISPDLSAPFLTFVILFGCLFAAAGTWLNRDRIRAAAATKGITAHDAVPIFSAALPFGLLILASLRLPMANPTPIFGVALLFSLILLGLAIIGRQQLLTLLALLCTLGVEAIWHSQHFAKDHPWTALGWYLGFYAVFTSFPFVFRSSCKNNIAPWAASALSGVGHFLLVHDVTNLSFHHTLANAMGLIPAAFAVPSIIALIVIVKQMKEMDDISKNQIAWFGGVALLFITLIFPIQFDRQWLTVSWALEGAALIWLFRRVPHDGLKWTGVALLAISFVRLGLNPAVINEYPRSGTAIFNWHLYTFGIVAAAIIAGAKLLPENHRKLGLMSLPGLLYTFGGILLFFLLNIEIADFFTPDSQRFINIEFSGNFARDMTYSIAWGLFSLILLGIGIRARSSAPRYASIGLLVVTLLKVFTHDLANIESIYRIGALIGVAIIAFIASFLYQRFYNQSNSPTKDPS